jgi:hypothetical protein
VLDHQQPQDALDGRRRAAVNQRPRPAAGQLGFHRLEQRIVVEQVIELGQHGIQRQA